MAYTAADAHGEVMVEKFSGLRLRLLVVGDRPGGCSRRDPPHVIGDGSATVRQLVDTAEPDPRRKRGPCHLVDQDPPRYDNRRRPARRQGLHARQRACAGGQRVVLRNNANSFDRRHRHRRLTWTPWHPEAAARGRRGVMHGLHICGLSTWSARSAAPARSSSHGIVEVNAAPGLRMHICPRSAAAAPVLGEAAVDALFAHGDDDGIRANGGHWYQRQDHHHAADQPHRRLQRPAHRGMTNTDGVYVDGRQTGQRRLQRPEERANVLLHPDVDAGPCSRSRAAACCARPGLRPLLGGRGQTNIGSGGPPGRLNYITHRRGPAVLKRVVRNVAPGGYAVLNAADPNVAAMANNCLGEVGESSPPTASIR